MTSKPVPDQPVPDTQNDYRGGSVAAVVVTYRRPDGLQRSLRALGEQERPLQRIYVIDNGGDIAELEQDNPLVRIIRPGSNTGPAGGFALGLQAASDEGFDWAYLLNDDDRPRPHAVGTLLAQAVAPQGQSRLVMGWVNLSGQIIPTGARWHRGLQPPPPADHDTPYDVDVITFGGLLVPTQVVREIGVPRADFFMMWEEYEYCLRARQHGYTITVVPTPLVDIDGLPPGSRSAPWRAYYEARNSSVTISNFGDFTHRWWWIKRQTKLALASCLAADRWPRLRFRLRGIVDGTRGRMGRVVQP